MDTKTSKEYETNLLELSLGSQEVSAAVTREAFKSMFYMIAGKPDSIVKQFKRRVLISKEDIIKLNSQIEAKLKNHELFGDPIVNIDVSFNNNTYIAFGDHKSFLDHKWDEPEIIQSILLRWDFLIQFPSYKAPQRHTVTVKISSGMKTIDILKTLVSGGPEDVNELDKTMAPVVCRVDFINTILSEEIINIIARWNEALRKPKISDSWIMKVRKYKQSIARIFNYTIPLVVGIACIWLYENFLNHLNMATSNEKVLIYWLLISGIIVYISFELATSIAVKTYKSLDQLGDFNIFQITKGDINMQDELDNDNKKLLNTFLFNTISVIVLNIIGGILATVIYNKLFLKS